MNTRKSLIAAALAVMFLSACSSGGVGDIFGGNDSGVRELRGTVESVDSGSRSIWLRNVSGYDGSMLSSGGNAVRVYYDDRTSVVWQGRSYQPQDLERGDEVTVRVDEQGNTLVADAVTVTYNVSSGTTPGSSNPGNNYATIRGTVRAIDTYNRTIELESATWRSGFTTGGSTSTNRLLISYDPNMTIDVNGQLHAVTGLERGDVIDVQVQANNNTNASTYWAQRIWLVRDVRN